MTAPYYQDESVTLYHGDCRHLADLWTWADVLVTDPPYGRAWSIPASAGHAKGGARSAHLGIANDDSTETRDDALNLWGSTKPAVLFGDLMLPPPAGTRRVLIYQKPGDAGIIGAGAGFRKDVEAIYLRGSGYIQGGMASAVIRTQATGVSGTLTTPYQHPHAKPLDVLETLIRRCPLGVIADPFMGSGSTLVAAKRLGRQAIGVEVEERYCEIAARRLSQGVLTFEEPA